MQTSVNAKDSDDDALVESKRKPTIEVHETPRMTIPVDKEFNFALKNLKLEYVHKLQDKNSTNSVKESEHVLVGAVKYKIQSLQKKIMKSDNQLQVIKKIDKDGIDKQDQEVVGLIYDDEEVQ